ncbi:MAG: hypothetical protein RL398_2251 [Planctomycetota bacterium]|jgi:putative nucleotidyltransferase with HDIG domain
MGRKTPWECLARPNAQMNPSTFSKLGSPEKTRREILHKSDLIPPLPDLVSKLLAALNNPATEPEHLEALLQNDPVLVARMLALVNSPYYGMNRTIRTIKDAVMVLGFRGVRSLVLATSAAKLLQRDFSCYGHEPKGLWLHSACVAAGAKLLARRCRLGEEIAEQMFVAGLLHDIGKLVLLPFVVGRRQLVGAVDVSAAERAAVGIDHTEAGALVAAKWNLATELQQVIKDHHEPYSHGDDVPQAIVRLANAVAQETRIGFLPEVPEPLPPMPRDLQTLAIDGPAWSAVRDELAAVMTEAAQTLSSLAG